MIKKITEKYLYNSAIAYLKRFPTSIPHFRKLMKRKINESCRTYPEQDVQACYHLLDELVEKLCQQGILNDEVYLEGRINSLRKRGHSARSIQQKLQQKGLLSQNIDEGLKQLDSNDVEAALIAFKRKRLAGKEPLKQIASLARSGFSYETIKSALKLTEELDSSLLYDQSY